MQLRRFLSILTYVITLAVSRCTIWAEMTNVALETAKVRLAPLQLAARDETAALTTSAGPNGLVWPKG
jgi:hypothetical protein